MRISNSHLQQLTIFTTVLTGAGISTMYYLLQSEYKSLQLVKLFISAASIMYSEMCRKIQLDINFSCTPESEFFRFSAPADLGWLQDLAPLCGLLHMFKNMVIQLLFECHHLFWWFNII